MFGLHELILYDFEDTISVLLCIHSQDIEMIGFHEQISCEFEDDISVQLCIHSEDMEMILRLHELISYE